MEHRRLILGTLILSIASVTGFVFSQEKKASSQKPADKSKGSPQEWMKLTMPGDHHKALDSLAGKWNLVLRAPAGTKETSEAKGKDKLTIVMYDVSGDGKETKAMEIVGTRAT